MTDKIKYKGFRMERVTKKSLEKFMVYKKNGELTTRNIKALEAMLRDVIPNTKVRYHYWSGTRKHMNITTVVDVQLLAKFCEVTFGNDGRGGVGSDYLIITKKERKKLEKRIAFFLPTV